MKTLVTFLILTLSSILFAQNTYLKISEDDKTSVSYPPGTKFVLKNQEGYYILKESSTPLVFKIDEPYTLDVFPTYKSEKDVYELSNGKIELVSNANYMNSIKHKRGKYQSYGVYLDNTTYTNSSVNKSESNVVLEFSNGVVFNYIDGKVSATLNEKDVEVKGHYLIYSETGVVKVSYNPENKELWWTYEPFSK